MKGELEPFILCSAGDFYGGIDIFNEPKDHFIARVMGLLGYDAIAVGETDLSFGLEKLVEDWKAYDLNLLCANLFPLESGGGRRVYREHPLPVFPAYRIVSRGGVKIGFVALLSPRTKVQPRDPGEENRVEALTYVIEDPVPIAKKLLPKVRTKCDVLVLLAHMDRAELERILPDLDGVDLAVLGHSPVSEFTKEPYQMGTVPVYKATYQGQYVGSLRISLDAKRKIADANNTIFTLDKTVADDPAIAALVTQFETDYRKVQKDLYAKQQLSSSSGNAISQDVYLGLGSCVRCHAEDFEVYTRTRHARAYATLSKMFQQRDASCIGCHSTGYGTEGGFSGARIVGSPIDLADVQCEACHGPGAEHSRDGRYADRAAESCTRCHNKEQDPDFEFSEAWKKIAH
ncbi:MAG: hypothetical protein HY770_01755 [Chitinivibrionia bacterium]|nr:hypothetical protein [Chitinivibrionia bacterium]